ncbi:MAG: dipeptidyl peptidase 3, partial [Proteiniphilum sp.]|nr:dipeptidyl peptidase 3 [Proteiniphilum sp.]
MKKAILMSTLLLLLAACNSGHKADRQTPSPDDVDLSTFTYKADRFADVEILRYPVPGFNSLTLQQKELIYYLSQAALEGRDILWDQHNRHNLTIRRVCESVYENYMGDKSAENWTHFETYLKRIWMANGIHHHYSEDKIMPEFPQEYFVTIVKAVDPGRMPFRDGMAADETLNEILPVMFDPHVMPKRMNQASDADMVATSAVNFYEGVTQKEVEDFYNAMKNPDDNTPVSYGLNSKIVKENGVVTEQVWKVGGMYGKAIERIVGWLEKAAAVAENDQQKKVINALVSYYRTGDLKTFDDYSVLWVADTASRVDFINGFIENYTDPLGMKASWESLVNFKSVEASERTRIISENAQWFENNSPVDDR